jgi:general secretion pathway protein D
MSNKQYWRHDSRLINVCTRQFIPVLCTGVITLALTGCAGYSQWRNGSNLIEQGKVGEGLEQMYQASQSNPEQYRLKYINARDHETRLVMQKATSLRLAGHSTEALAAYQQVLQLDSQNAEARQGIELITREQRQRTEIEEARTALAKGDAATARQLLTAILSENPGHADARRLLQQVEARSTRNAMLLPALNQSLQKPVTLELKDVDIRSVLAILTQTSGISFVLDKDVSPDLRTTIYARNTTIADALNLILQTSQLDRKILNDSTLLIYSATDEKRKRYDDLVVRSYYLNSGDPKKLQDMLHTLVAPKSMYVDERLKMLVVRDTEQVQDAIVRLLDLYDIASPEVILDVEVLEVNSNDLLNVGIQFPSTVSASLVGPSGIPGSVTIDDLKSLNKNSFPLTFPDPIAVLNLRQISGSTRTLANPRIRVLNHEKASVLIGDKVPVITSTVNQTSNAITESINYLDVGLKLEVEPEIHIDNDVTMRVALEVSNIVKEVRSSATGLLAYQIGTRNANTVLRLHEGETQALAGLIKSESQMSGSHVPGLGKIPLIGRLFSNDSDSSTRSEIVLLITPHLTRSLATPSAYAQAFPSGTAEQVSTHPLRLTPAAQYSDTDNLPPPPVPAQSGSPSETARNDVAAVGSLPASGAPSPPTALSDQTDVVLFDLTTPSQVTQKTGFNVDLLANGPGFGKAEFDLVFDQPGVKLLKIEPRAGVALNADPQENRLHVSVGTTAQATGPIAALTLEMQQPSNGPLNLSLQNLKVENEAHAQVGAAVALPKQITVSP